MPGTRLIKISMHALNTYYILATNHLVCIDSQTLIITTWDQLFPFYIRENYNDRATELQDSDL